MNRHFVPTLLVPLALIVSTSCGSAGNDPDEPVVTDVPVAAGPDDRARADVCSGDRPEELTTAAGAFADTYCDEIGDVDDLYDLLGLPVATATQLEVLRIGVCTPDAPTPSREQSEAAFELFVRTSAEQDPALAARWLDAGVLTAPGSAAPTVGDLDDLEVDTTTIDRLAGAEQGLFETVAADPAAFCDS